MKTASEFALELTIHSTISYRGKLVEARDLEQQRIGFEKAREACAVPETDDVECRMCGAEVGEPCWDIANKHPAAGRHFARFADAIRALTFEEVVK